jgi:hypothetical protein
MLRRGLFGLLLIAAVFVSFLSTLPPQMLPADAPADVFSAARAAETIRVIARSPRLVGSPTFQAAREYLIQQMARQGLAVTTQDLTLEGIQVENTLGRLEGKSSRQAILLVAHLDSVAEGPGAMDNASGVAEVLETLRALRAGPPLENTVIILFTAPEEACCVGARAFATKHPWAKDVRLVVNTDAGGVAGPSILSATGPGEGWLIRQMAGILPDPIASSAIEAFADPHTDYYSELRHYEWPGLDFNLSWVKRIHTPLDSLENIHLDSVQHQGEHLLAVTRHFAGLPLDFPREPNPIYFDILGIFIIQYPAAWSAPLFVLLTVGLGLVISRILRRRWPDAKGVALGALAPILGLATVPLILLALQKWLVEPMSFHSVSLREMLTGDSLLSNAIRWGSVVLTIAAVILWAGLALRWIKGDRDDLVLGTYLLMYAGAGLTLALFPAVSYLIVWPLLYGLAAMLIRWSGKRAASLSLNWASFIGWTGAALVATLLLVPGIIVAVLSVEIQSIFLIPLFVGLWGTFLVGPILMVLKK